MKDEKTLLSKLSEGNVHAFTSLFHHYYKDLVLFAGSYIKDMAACEDIVQSVFVKLWTKRQEAPLILSLKPFLLKSIQNSCLSHIRHLNIKHKYAGLTSLMNKNISYETEEYILYSELNTRLQDALTRLSYQQRQCFEMHRIQGIKQSEIAKILNIPLRTVELRISESRKILKKYLKEYFNLILFLLSL